MPREDAEKNHSSNDSAANAGVDPPEIESLTSTTLESEPMKGLSGIVALRKWTNGGKEEFYVTISSTVSELGYDAGDYLRLRCNEGWGDENLPPALQIDRLPDPSNYDLSDPLLLPITTIDDDHHLVLPRRVVDPRGLGIDPTLGSYDPVDPFLFEKVHLPASATFFLHPLGYRSEVFRDDGNFSSPIPEEYIATIAESFEIDQSALSASLDSVARTLSVRTFEAAHLSTADIDPIKLQLPSDFPQQVGYRSVTIYFTPADNRQSTLLELFTDLYQFPEPIAKSCWSAHQAFARALIVQSNNEGADSNNISVDTGLNGADMAMSYLQTNETESLADGIPPGHPVIDPDYETIVSPD